MSYAPSAFNFSFIPTATFPSGSPFDFGSNSRFSQVHQQSKDFQQQQVPESIGYQNQHTDYYGNQQNFPQQSAPKPTGRRRRPKNRRNNNAPLSYSSQHVQTVQDFQSLQNPDDPTALNTHRYTHTHDIVHPLVRVTPIQGPIFAKDGHLPVVPLYSYNAVKNGTLYQIPILWTALSYALGLEIRGEILRGLPCIKRLNQLFCPTAGNTYPLDNIERFIDENKALIKRMYGEFVMNSPDTPSQQNPLRRTAREVYEHEVADFLGKSNQAKGSHLAENLDQGNSTEHVRKTRQTVNPRNGGPTQQPKSSRVDSCESTVEITTPYWAANSAGKVRAIVNTQHFEQAIQQEVCTKTSTKRCVGECGCEQKYKWHRLLAYDPDNDCRGIFMDWFLFPSCCVCRCDP